MIYEQPIKKPLGRQRLRWEDCVKKDIVEDPGVNWKELTEDERELEEDLSDGIVLKARNSEKEKTNFLSENLLK